MVLLCLLSQNKYERFLKNFTSVSPKVGEFTGKICSFDLNANNTAND
jgi:hypothetical protein